MVGTRFIGGMLALAAVTLPGGAAAVIGSGGSRGGDAPPYLQCVPYARQVTGIAIYGDAHTWWDQAAGHYARGSVPRVGAVMAFRASGGSRLGHVAAVSKIVDSRTVLISHANWSPINGRRGQIERNVKAVDVSPANDWSEVRVWFAPIHALGSKRWALDGFIYNKKPGWTPGKDKPAFAKAKALAEEAPLAGKPKPGKIGKAHKIGRDFAEDPIGAIIAAKGKLSDK